MKPYARVRQMLTLRAGHPDVGGNFFLFADYRTGSDGEPFPTDVT
jgi:hypothetical protein